MAILPTAQPQTIYVLEKEAPKAAQPPALLDQIRRITGIALAFLGLAILFGASLSLANYLAGSLTMTAEAIHPFFMTGIACSISGFHLAKDGDNAPGIDISLGF